MTKNVAVVVLLLVLVQLRLTGIPIWPGFSPFSWFLTVILISYVMAFDVKEIEKRPDRMRLFYFTLAILFVGMLVAHLARQTMLEATLGWLFFMFGMAFSWVNLEPGITRLTGGRSRQ